MPKRCEWVPEGDSAYVAYHDQEWGVPSHEDRHLFEMLVLEGAQAGLSWSTILRKREGYRRAFAGFDAERVARLGKREVERLLADPGIVRNRLKVESAVSNAKGVLEIREEFGSLDSYLWGFVGGEPIFSWGDLDRPSFVASVRKSVLSVAFGRIVADGRLDLDATLAELDIDDITPMPIARPPSPRAVAGSYSGSERPPPPSRISAASRPGSRGCRRVRRL
jgi:DNA-3-methyladenine glycosylase I